MRSFGSRTHGFPLGCVASGQFAQPLLLCFRVRRIVAGPAVHRRNPDGVEIGDGFGRRLGRPLGDHLGERLRGWSQLHRRGAGQKRVYGGGADAPFTAYEGGSQLAVPSGASARSRGKCCAI